jgi:predicted  nucleic acid-binding Zn-ribbon protein
MAQQIKKKFIGNNEVDGSKVLLDNNQAIRSKDQLGVEQDILKLDASDKIVAKNGANLEEIAFQPEVDAIEGRVTTAEGEIDTLQSEMDAVEIDVSNLETLSGVAGDTDLGAFIEGIIPANSDIKEALQALESAVDAISGGGSGSLAALQQELDDTQEGAGLEVDGSYIAPAVSNYLSAAVSLKDADSKLDSEIKVVADDLAQEVLDRGQADSDLQDEIDATQLGAGLGVDGSYTAPSPSNYLTMATSLFDADEKLDSEIKIVADAVADAVSDLQDHINASVDAHDASAISFNNAASGLTAINAQDAIDEVEARVDTAESDISALEGRMDTAELDISNLETDLSNHLNATVDAHDASAISVVPNGNLAASDAQAALEELQGDIDSINTIIGGLSFAASAISVAPAGNIDATDVQGALEELDDEKVAKAGDTMTGNLTILPVVDESESTLSHTSVLFTQKDAGNLLAEGNYSAIGFVVTTYDPITSDVLTVATLAGGKFELQDGNGDAILPVEEYDVAVKKYVDDQNALQDTALSNHINDADDAHDASAISFSNPVSGLAANNVQAAIDELAAEKLNLSGGTMSGNIIMGNNSITNVLMTSDPHSVATREYVDTVAEGLHIHAPARLLAAVDLGGTYNNGSSGIGAHLDFSTPVSSIDGVSSFSVGDRIILTFQNGSALDIENGIYYIEDAADINIDGDIIKLTRTQDFDSPAEMAGGDFIFVQEGSTYADTGWVMTETVVAVGTTPVQFLQFSGAGAYTAGDGLDLNGTVFSVNVSELVGDGIEDDGSNNFKVKVSDIAGAGLEDDLSNNLRIKLDGSSLAVSASGLKSNVEFYKEKYSITSTLTTGAFFDLDFLAEVNSISAFVDRLAIHEGASEDFTVSVVGGVTRVTFVNDLVTPGQSQLSNGDSVYFKYQKKIS